LKARVAIIGSGPSGLASAGVLGSQAVVFEQRHELGGKILVSGSGQCNFTHSGTPAEFARRYGSAGKWLKHALYAHTSDCFIEAMNRNAVPTVIRDDGKAFPASLKAGDVRDALVREAKGAELRPDTPVVGLDPVAGGFLLRSPAGDEHFCAVIMTCGGRTAQISGGRPDGYTLAAALGHGIVDPHPALTPVYAQPHPLAELSGISLEAALLLPGAKPSKAPRGPLLITHFGFSGPLILDHSRDIRPDDDLALDLIPGGGEKLTSALVAGGTAAVKTVLLRHEIPRRLAETLLQLAEIPPGLILAQLTRAGRERLLDLTTRFPVHVGRLGDWREAMCTAGGVRLEEVDSRTMASRIVPGLYFAGEILDYDGDSGGYNIQAAWSTGRVAGLAALQACRNSNS
jgi:predicted Rossmann fold flavoprotein